jgi:hypothetical protein
VLKTVSNIQGKRYVRVEGWQAIANAFGCFPSVTTIEAVAGGIRAVAEIHLSDGRVVRAEGFVGDDEPTWSKRPMFARRAMAQTRAVSRVCRSAFAFVVVMIDSGLSTTPAEEMEAAMEAEASDVTKPKGLDALKAKVPASPPRQVVVAAEPPPHTDDDAPGSGRPVRKHSAVTFRFGKSIGRTSFEVTDRDLQFYMGALERSVADPDKARFRDDNEAELELLQAEAAYRNL